MSLSPSKASMVKLSFRPFTSVRVAVAEIVEPTDEGARCEVSMYPPTVVVSIGRWGETAFMAAFSMSATSDGVANTARSPDPIAMAVLLLVTFMVDVYCNPSVSICV